MVISSKEIDYFTYSQELFKGKEVYNKRTNKVLQKWESYIICKQIWEMVIDNTHIEWACRDKQGYEGGLYVGRVLKSVKKTWGKHQ
jgi:hypothetical protein